MSHSEIAQLWYELEGRQDLNFILREVFGRVWLPSQRNATEIRIEALLLAKLIFDYQRYIIRTTQLPNNLLLSHSELIFFVKCIVQIANEQPPRARRDSPQISSLRNLIVQAFTSGTRALVLCAEYQQLDIAASIQDLFNAWITKDNEDGQILERLLVPTIYDLHSRLDLGGSAILCSRHFRSLEVYPDNPRSLHHSIEQLHQVTASARCCIEDGCPQKHRSFWEWMDLELTMVVSSYQLLGCDFQSDEDPQCHHLGHEQKHMWLPDLQSFSQDWKAVHISLAPLINNSPMKQYKLWLRRLQPLPVCNESHGTKCFLPDDIDTTMSSLAKHFRSLSKSLHVRAQATSKSTRTTQYVLDSARQDIALWLGPPKSSLRSQEDLDLDFMLYAVSCSKAHVFRYEELFEELQPLQDDIDAGLHRLERGDEEFPIRLKCPRCEQDGQQQMQRLWARKIVPLDRLPLHIHGTGLTQQLDQSPSTPPPSTPPILPALRPSSSSGTKRSRLSIGTSVSPSSSGTNMSPALEGLSPSTNRPLGDKKSHTSSSKMSKYLPGFMTRTSGSSSNSPRLKLKPVLGSDGKFMIVHSSQLASCYSFASQSWSTKQIHGVDLQCAATSFQYCAFADKISIGTAPEKWCLRIHNTISGNEVACPALPKDIKYPIKALVFSRDGSRLAMSTETSIEIIDTATIATGRWQHVRLAPATQPGPALDILNTQVLTYTPDGAFLCLATRFRPSGSVTTVIVQDDNRSGPFKLYKPKQFKIDASLTSDHGLTAIACIHTQRSVDYLVCSSTNATGPPKVRVCPIQEMSTEGGRSRSVGSSHARQQSGSQYELHDGKHLLDQKLQNAVAFESTTSHFIAASDYGQLFHVDLDQQQTRAITSAGAVHRPGTRGSYEPVQMAATGDGLVRIVWLEDGMARIAEVNLGQAYQLEYYNVQLRPYRTDDAPLIP